MIALIPITCWRPDAEMLKCRIIAEGANGPTTPDADAIIDARGDIFVIPDILCTAGRRDRQLFRMSAAPSEAIVDEAEILKRLYQILDRSFEQVIRSVERMASRTGTPPCRSESSGSAMPRKPGDCFLEVEDGRSAVSSSGIRSKLCQREAQIRRTLRVTLPKTLRPRQRTCIS
jgi:hypothetical protein